MKELLRTYYYRLVHEKSTWVFFILSLCFTFIQVLIMAIIKQYGGYADGSLANIHLNLLFSGAFYIAIAFIFFYLTRDWKDGTFRNLTLAGKSRNQIFIAGFIAAFTIFLAFMAASLGLAWIIAAIGKFPIGLNNSYAVQSFFVSWGMSFLLQIVVLILAVSFSFLIPSAFGSMGCFIGFLVALEILGSLISLLTYSVAGLSASNSANEWFLVNDISTWSQYFTYSYYLDDSFAYVDWLYKTFIVSLGLSGIFIFFSRLSFVSRDLK